MNHDVLQSSLVVITSDLSTHYSSPLGTPDGTKRYRGYIDSEQGFYGRFRLLAQRMSEREKFDGRGSWKQMRNNTPRCRSLSYVIGPTRGIMTKDKNGALSDECIYCGTYTEGMIRDIPMRRACAKELEADPDPSLGSKAV